MRKQFVNTVEDLMKSDNKLVTLLGDISVFGFRNAKLKYPNRVYNTGILEQGMVGMAAGMSLIGLIPVVHTIAPFLIERAYEQLKLDFGYQRLNGNFVSVGASCDYAALGATHQCPADIGILKDIPGMEIVVPGTAKEFDLLFRQAYNDGKPTYFRLSETQNQDSVAVEFGKANLIKEGRNATIIVVGNMLDPVLEAVQELDVTVLYYTTLVPFDKELLREFFTNGKILLCEPYYYGALDTEIFDSLGSENVIVNHCGIPHKFIESYGSVKNHFDEFGFDTQLIKKRIGELINA